MKRESIAGTKKKWAKPKLIILTRGKPEESVLAGCKVNLGGGGPNNDALDCDTWDGSNSTCGECLWPATS